MVVANCNSYYDYRVSLQRRTITQTILCMFVNKTKPHFPLPRGRHHISNFQPSPPSLRRIKQTHAHVVVSGRAQFILHLLSLLSLSSFVPFPLHYCVSIFNSISFPAVFAFNSLIRCHAKANSSPSLSLALYSSMRRRFVKSNQHTFTFLLHACSKNPNSSSNNNPGVQIHAHVIKLGYARDVFVRNALIHFYCECCSSVDSSKRVFEEDTLCSDVVTWNSMLAGFVRNGEVHAAEELFDEMPERDVVSWSTMIMGYVQNGLFQDGLECFREMRDKRVRPNEAVLVTVLSASAQLGLLGCGRFIHSTIQSLRFPITVPIGTALVDMYAKCGCIEQARSLFDGMLKRDAWTWNVMICGLASHDHAKEALLLFQKFINEGFCPVNVTFVGVLNACSRAGLVSEGRHYFKLMVDGYGIQPEMEHYGCMVELLARACLIDEAVQLIDTMAVTPDPVLWAILLDACKIHGFVEMGEKIGNKLIQLDPTHDAHYVQLAGIYAKARKWEDVVRIRRLMAEKVANKVAGWSLIEVQGRVHRFVAGDREHECSSDIYKLLETIGLRITEAGYSPKHLNTAVSGGDLEMADSKAAFVQNMCDELHFDSQNASEIHEASEGSGTERFLPAIVVSCHLSHFREQFSPLLLAKLILLPIWIRKRDTCATIAFAHDRVVNILVKCVCLGMFQFMLDILKNLSYLFTDAIVSGVDGYDAEIKKSVRKAADGL
ncbi:hypothetical protein VNO77_43408 [Canavalia gladiata]|uniref:Pentatricopeptide repeat-containing protein n=1 Tax=Canavalia gladiata TaxID=3824 RepID=A0AAN9JUS0_CANGL